MREETQGVAYFFVEQTAGFKASKALSQLRNAVVRRPWESLGPCREVLVPRVAVLEKETCGLGSDASGCGSSLPARSKFPLNSHLFVAQWMCPQQLEWPSPWPLLQQKGVTGVGCGCPTSEHSPEEEEALMPGLHLTPSLRVCWVEPAEWVVVGYRHLHYFASNNSLTY